MTAHADMLEIARAEALCISGLPMGDRPSQAEATEVIRRTMRRLGGTRGCAIAMAGEYGEHPETIAARMRWARATVHVVYQRDHAQADRMSLASMVRGRPATEGGAR